LKLVVAIVIAIVTAMAAQFQWLSLPLLHHWLIIVLSNFYLSKIAVVVTTWLMATALAKTFCKLKCGMFVKHYLFAHQFLLFCSQATLIDHMINLFSLPRFPIILYNVSTQDSLSCKSGNNFDHQNLHKEDY